MKMAEVRHFDGKKGDMRFAGVFGWGRENFFAFFPSKLVHSPCF
ncbi:hypothetical protein NMH_0243 [Neisseria meningitidis H44/76]|uniref:Uncharacterized protein n=1 Tax=Neisseria meningitidis serogroup B / serotype 15 (strain H44/76) TaxID=909420 RepID=E6MU01_NEIMH|nr:hypothetical protein NMH_0243 [Neisseria meningitidis H44/76]